MRLHIFLFLEFLLMSSLGYANNIGEYRYYQLNFTGSYTVYIKKNDPCIFVNSLKKNKIKRFCDMGESGLNLEKSKSSIHIDKITLFANNLRFLVLAPWNEQECKIHLTDNNITCNPTGR